jgi:hypothetical protein|tara:strand:- start:1412 stop:1609 length:198 start_codon:yes stop_codon:yes gene_type:complete
LNDLDVVQFVQQTLKGRKAQIQELMCEGGIKDMEHYRECMGEIRACDYVLVELSEMLEKQEQRNA